MYLKSIEIQGFKSFANKIRLEFNDGITGIVGPNGSGKSNVADAVRWVLGEQRVKQLRGSSMQDVIFAGTQSRKPMGYAYVAITLDNADHKLPTEYREVTVARRIYRSGESEYLMNGAACRLRDVQELFYDTGIGKEGYSIIGQGQIDKILSDKPEDRRELFDEAVGIVKFKRRKAISLKKLAGEKDNLVRIQDILAELEKQIPALEKQSEKARTYLRERDRLRNREVNLFLLDNERKLEELQSVQNQLQIAQTDLENAREEYARSGASYEAAQERLQELEKEIEQARSRITDASVVRGKLEGDLKVCEEQIRVATQNTAHFQSRRESVCAEIDRSDGERGEILAQKQEIDGQLAALQREQGTVSRQAENCRQQISALSEQVDLGKNEILRILSERATIKSRLAGVEIREEEIGRRERELETSLQEAQSSQTQQSLILEDLRKEFADVGDSLREMQKRQREIEDRIGEMKQRLGNEDEQLRASQLSFHQEQARLDALVNLTQRYEGFGGSVRRVMQKRSEEAGVLGVVADLLRTGKRYETAIEVALGGNIQNIVVEDAGTAGRMIELLKRERAGRATFLPLADLGRPPEFRNERVLGEEGVIGLADSLVQCEERYRPVAKSLLGRIVIVDTYEHALRANKKFGHTVRMVTLEGELFMPGGAISGGAYRNSSNLLGRRREMAELQEKVRECADRVQSHEQAIADVKKERSQLRIELEENRKAQQETFVRQNTLRMRITREKEKQREAAGNAQELVSEQRQIEKQKASLAAERVQAAEGLRTSREREESLNAEVGEQEGRLKELREQEMEKTQALARWDAQIGGIVQQQSFAQQNLERVEADLRRRQEELQQISGTLEESGEIIRRGEERIRELREQIASSGDVQGENEKRLREKSEERDRRSREMKEQIARRDTLSEKVHALDKECVRLQTRHERLQEAVDARIAYMWEEYEITLSDAKTMRDETSADPGSLQKEIGEIKGRIRALGSVNVDAIEQYRELMERYTFLKGQHDDLTEAAQNLEKIIGELDTSMRRQFREQFSRIQEEFDAVFKEMFGGGRGRLELMEEQDILEAGVRVIAQPPGKKLQNMNALSGGEKALTAIALLFAIQNLKPSPFCLLDEIEAALDESNVVRFAEYLHKLTNHTQFIVITHRRGTMEEADRLYGITMQEKGVSALVSVDLIDDMEESNG